jgi:hypothetical protein
MLLLFALLANIWAADGCLLGVELICNGLLTVEFCEAAVEAADVLMLLLLLLLLSDEPSTFARTAVGLTGFNCEERNTQN